DLTNNGAVVFDGVFPHSLGVGADYTQSSGGTLSMRLDVGTTNDSLLVTGTADLAGLLDLTGLSTLSAKDVWTIIVSSTQTGNFTSFMWPDSNPLWVASPGAAYSVSN